MLPPPEVTGVQWGSASLQPNRDICLHPWMLQPSLEATRVWASGTRKSLSLRASPETETLTTRGQISRDVVALGAARSPGIAEIFRAAPPGVQDNDGEGRGKAKHFLTVIS